MWIYIKKDSQSDNFKNTHTHTRDKVNASEYATIAYVYSFHI